MQKGRQLQTRVLLLLPKWHRSTVTQSGFLSPVVSGCTLFW